MEVQRKDRTEELPAFNRPNSGKKKPLGINQRISLKIKAKMHNLEDMNPTTDTDIKGTFADLDDKYIQPRKRRTQLDSIQYMSNGALKMTPPCSSDGAKQNPTIVSIQRRVNFLLQQDQAILDYITRNKLNPQLLRQEVSQSFFMLHLLQQATDEESLRQLLLRKVKSIHGLQKSKTDYQRSESKMDKLLRDQMKHLSRYQK